jgi:hypothetical protein
MESTRRDVVNVLCRERRMRFDPGISGSFKVGLISKGPEGRHSFQRVSDPGPPPASFSMGANDVGQ